MSARTWWVNGVVLVMLVLAVTACREQVTGPGVCPDFCPPVRLQLIDTTLTGAVEREEWSRGYLSAYTAGRMQVVADPTGRNSVAVMRFLAFADSIQSGIGLLAIQSVDSLRFSLTVLGATDGVADLELVLHRLPVSVDSLTSYADIVAFIDDSTEIAAIPIVVSDTTDTLSAAVPPTAFPDFVADSLTVAIGIALRTASGGFANLASEQGASSSQAPSVRRYVTADSAGTDVELSDLRRTRIDTFLYPDQPDPGPDVVVVGGTPSARAFARVRVPGRILDSASVSRATLLLLPERGALGGPGDTLLLQSFGLTADVGPKSPFFALPLDSIDRNLARVPVGSTDTIRIDVTRILQTWQNDSSLPRAMLLRVSPEAGTTGEFWLRTSRSPTGAPALRITYAPRFVPEP